MRSRHLRAGISRIDLLFAIAVVGVLTAIVLGNLRNTRAEANVDLLRTQLRDLQVAEEAYWSQHSRYSTDTTQLAWKPLPDVTLSIASLDPAVGFDAEVRHRNAPGVTCRVYVGRASVRPSGVITCGKP